MTDPVAVDARSSFSRWAWAFVAYLLGVILFGAWVRISHSGAGCGEHWPLCNGELLPLEPRYETLVEYTHRLTSGLCGLFGLGLLAWAWRRFPRGHVVRRCAAATLVFILVEAAIGAGLVLKSLVVDDASLARAVVIAMHLFNTFLLTASAALTAWWAERSAPPWAAARRVPWFVCGLVLIVLVAMTGAVTALGDTLFPALAAGEAGLLARLREDVSPARHFLVRLRIVHPVLASASVIYLVTLAFQVREIAPRPTAHRLAGMLLAALGVQVVAGFLNIALSAPGWLQLIHLLGAQLLWLALVLLSIECAAEQPAALESGAAPA